MAKMEIPRDINVTLNRCTKHRKYSRKPTNKRSSNSIITATVEKAKNGLVVMGKGRGRRRCRRCRSPHLALRSANTVQHNTELDSTNFTRLCERIHTRVSLPHFAQQNVPTCGSFHYAVFHYCCNGSGIKKYEFNVSHCQLFHQTFHVFFNKP